MARITSIKEALVRQELMNRTRLNHPGHQSRMINTRMMMTIPAVEM